jgi:hypothetical protein
MDRPETIHSRLSQTLNIFKLRSVTNLAYNRHASTGKFLFCCSQELFI